MSCVVGSPVDRLAVHGNEFSTTLYASSKTFENSSMMYGTVVKSAVLSMKATTVVPASTSVPSVGQSLTASVALSGEKLRWSSPLSTNDVATVEALTLSMLTMRIETTSVGLATTHVLTSVRYDVSVPASSSSCGGEGRVGVSTASARRGDHGGRTQDEWHR